MYQLHSSIMIPLGKLSNAAMTWSLEGTIPKEKSREKSKGYVTTVYSHAEKNSFKLLTVSTLFQKETPLKARESY